MKNNKQVDEIVENLVQELKRGTLVLSVLLSTEQPVYGYALVSRLQGIGVQIEQNTLYPLLRRLETQGLLESLWDTTESRPRKYYRISELGIQVRSRLDVEWSEINKAIERMKHGTD